MSQRTTSTNSDFHDLIEMIELSGNWTFTGRDFGGGFQSNMDIGPLSVSSATLLFRNAFLHTSAADGSFKSNWTIGLSSFL